MLRTILSIVAALVLTTCTKRNVKPPAALLPVPTANQLAWHEMETNAFIHFTINTFTDKEWGYGDEKETLFNPTELNTDQWAKTLKDAGFKTIILTCKHHDGFCLWPSAHTNHSIKNSPWLNGKGDLVKSVSESVRKQGLNFGIYVSPWDRNRADYGQPSYVQYYRDQLKELFTQYGPVTEMWFDGANGGDGYYGGARENRTIDKTKYYDWPTTLGMVRKMEPEILFFSDAGPGVRWVGNERGTAGETNWNNISIDTLYAGQAGIEGLLNSGSETGKQWVPAEVDVSIRPGWFYHAKEDSLVKTPEQLFEIYLTSVGRGSTLLLNFPPDRRGLIHENDVKSLEGWRAMIAREFKNNLASHAKVTATSWRGGNTLYAPDNLTDGNKDTYWATEDEVNNASIEVSLNGIHSVKYAVLQEYIQLGQRIRGFTIDAMIDGKWTQISEGTTIGYKRILRFSPVSTDRIRINFTSSKACPVISNLEIY